MGTVPALTLSMKNEAIDLALLATVVGGNAVTPGNDTPTSMPGGTGLGTGGVPREPGKQYWENSPPGSGSPGSGGPHRNPWGPGRPTFDMRGNHPRPPGPGLGRSDRRLKRRIRSL
jgi:hypothetical protein